MQLQSQDACALEILGRFSRQAVAQQLLLNSRNELLRDKQVVDVVVNLRVGPCDVLDNHAHDLGRNSQPKAHPLHDICLPFVDDSLVAHHCRGVGSVSGLARPEMGTSKGGHPGKKMKIGTYVLMINAKLEKGKGFLVTSTSCMGAE